MARPFGWRSAVFVLFVACTGDNLVAPGVCPQFCTSVGVTATDSLFGNSVRKDSTYSGYVPPWAAQTVMVAGQGSALESRAILRFYQFSDTVILNVGDTITRPVAQIDSFKVMIVVNRQTPGATMSLGVYRLPKGLDSSVTYAQVDPYFNDSTKLGLFQVPPPPRSTDSIFFAIPAGDLPTLRDDSLNVAIGLAIALSNGPSFVELGAAEALRGAELTEYLKVDSIPGTRVERTAIRAALLDTYVFPPPPPLPANVLSVGGAPSSRSFIRLDLPHDVVDSAQVVRATLFLIPTVPVLGPPGDTLRLVAHALSTDIGPKSPIRPAVSDSAGRVGARIIPGSTDTIKVDITDVIRSWKGDSLSPRALALALEREGGSWAELRFWSSANVALRPLLDITFVPPVKYEGR